MKINIKGGGTGKGYGSYVLREGKKDIDYSKITTLSGDMALGNEIVKSSNYKDNQFNIILEFKGKISDAEAKQVTDDFQELFMHGFDKSEYHFDAVLHQDTANSHVHIRIPKKNLLTDTTLRLYMDSTDRERVNIIRDYLEEKHGLEKMKDNRRLQPKPQAEVIQKWREERGQKPFEFAKKKGRDKAQNYIVNYIAEVHEAGLINDIEDVKNLVSDLDLEFVRKGEDYKSNTHYLTFKNETGKISLKGELFNEQFYRQFKKEDREKQIRHNRNERHYEGRSGSELQKLTSKLEKANNRRQQEIEKRYGKARERSKEGFEFLQRELREAPKRRTKQTEQSLQNNTTVANNDISSSSIFNLQKLEREANSERVESAEETSIHKREWEQVYSHTSKRYTALARQRNLLYPNRKGGMSGTDRNTTGRYGTTEERERPERTSSYEQFSEARESLYSQARAVVQDRANSRGTRARTAERTREKINDIGAEFTELESAISRRYNQFDGQSADIIESAKELTKAIEQKLRPQQEEYHSYGMRM